MMQDIFIPSKIGSYYIFSKRVLGFEITTSSVQACLVYFSKNKVSLENSMQIVLQDQNPATIINAIKKIATTIGKYDEVVTSLTSSAVVFKELTLPFAGREKIAMIINYEVEPLLPFSLDEAVVDFLITDENKEKTQTTVLVAAVRKIDLHAQTEYFEKAGVQLANVTLDMFALYDFYRHTMYVAQAYTSLLFVDFGIDAIRLLYIQKGILKSVRLVPYGLVAMMRKVDEKFQLSSHSSLEQALQEDLKVHDEEKQHQITEQLIADFCKQITLSISFFGKQIKNFTPPVKIICLGVGTQLQGFSDRVTEQCQIPVEILDIKRIAYRNNIRTSKKIKMDAQHSSSLILSLSAIHYGHVNFLSFQQKKLHNYLLNSQLFIALALSIIVLAGIYVASNYQLKQWDTKYNISKKEMTTFLKDQMDIDVKGVKRVSEIVATAQTKLQEVKKVCISFSEPNSTYLNYLAELCTKIDRKSIGLDLKKLSMHDDKVVLQGKVKDFDALEIFEEELMEMKSFIMEERPRELIFTVTLKAQEEQDKGQE